MNRIKGRMMKIYWFSVVGRGSFPFKMLAKSRAWPKDESASSNIEFSCPTVAPEATVILFSNKQPTREDYELWKKENWPIINGGVIA